MRNKILLSFVLISMIFISCEKCEITDVNNSDSFVKSTEVHNVNYDIISQYANARFVRTKTNTIKVDAIKMDNDTLAYIINHDNGWELLAADSRNTPSIDKGDGVYNTDSLNPGQKAWLELELCGIKAVKEGNKIIDSEEVKRNITFWEKLKSPILTTKAEGDPIEDNLYWELVDIREKGGTTTTSGHMIRTRWGQDFPWNSCVPYDSSEPDSLCKTGCVAVSGAQMLHYLHEKINKPATFYTTGNCYGTNNSYTFAFSDNNSSAWDNMALSISTIDLNKWHQSSILIGWVGWKADLDYGLEGTSGHTEDLKDVFAELGISSTYGDYNKNVVWSSLLNNMPVIVNAHATKKYTLGIPSYHDAHSWIIDGYSIVENQFEYVYEWTSETDNHLYEYGEQKVEIVTETTNYIQMNWGYDGRGDNTFYALGANWYESINSLTYQYQKKMLYNFQ